MTGAPVAGELWVLGEKLLAGASTALEVLGIGRVLADELGVLVALLTIEDLPKSRADDLILRGADRIYRLSGGELEDEEQLARVIVGLAADHNPTVLLAGATRVGRSILPRVAAGLETGLSADSTGLGVDESGVLYATKPAYGDNAMAEIVCPERRPQMVTVRPGAFAIAEADETRRGEVIEIDISRYKSEVRVSLIQEIGRRLAETSELQDARIVVGVGRGLGGQENLPLVEELAEILGASLGATRAVVDAGWLPRSCQIGQTGKIIAPRLYLACGLSGSIQHTVGIEKAETVVAINKDASAPIFDKANIGIVGDVLEVVPELTRELRKKRAG